MKILYECILESLKQGNALVEVTIIEQHGSAPRTSGAKMLVMQNAPNDSASNGLGKGTSIRGTVGGGLYEAKTIELAQTFFATHSSNFEQISHQDASHQHLSQALIIHFDLRGKHFPSDMDMVCGGELRLLVEYIPVTKEACALYEALVRAEISGKECTLVTRVEEQARVPIQGAHYEVHTNKALCFANASDSMNLNTQILPDTVRMHIMNNENKKISNLILNGYEYIFETLHKPYTIHIFGAGHVSHELAKITDYLDFKTIVLDDRAEFANSERFPNALSLVLTSLEQACITNYFSTHTPDSHDGLVIVTRGHARDRDVLAASLQTKAGYIGMIGSKSKRQTTYDYLLNNGYNKEDFARIHSPIGLSIGAQTPQEIAISITAQLIQWRAGCIQAENAYV